LPGAAPKKIPRADEFSAWGFTISTKTLDYRSAAGLLACASAYWPHLPEALVNPTSHPSGVLAAVVSTHSGGSAPDSHRLPYYLPFRSTLIGQSMLALLNMTFNLCQPF